MFWSDGTRKWTVIAGRGCEGGDMYVLCVEGACWLYKTISWMLTTDGGKESVEGQLGFVAPRTIAAKRRVGGRRWLWERGQGSRLGTDVQGGTYPSGDGCRETHPTGRCGRSRLTDGLH